MISTLGLMILVGTLAAALPSTLLEDAQQAAHSASGIVGGRHEELPTAIPLTSRTKSIHQQHVQGVAMTKPSAHKPHYSNGQHAQYQKQDIAHQQEDKTVSQYEKGYQYGVGKAALDKHVENALLKSELYGDPGKFSMALPPSSVIIELKMVANATENFPDHKTTAVNQYRYYGGANERKSNQQITYPAPTKRSFHPMMSYVLPSDELTNNRARLKRELGFDPEDVLTVLSLWEADHHTNSESHQGLNPSWYSYYGLHPQDIYRPIEENEEGDENEQEEAELDNDDTAQIDGDWLDSPVSQPSTYPHQLRFERRAGYIYPQLYPQQHWQYQYPSHKRESSHWGGFAKDKRFMVSRKRQVKPEDETQTLTQLLNHPYRDPGVPVYRRVIL